MSDWHENSNGNFVYVIDTDDVMTVFERAGLWFGVYDNRFMEEGLSTPEKAMAFMEMAVLNEQLHLLIKRTPIPTGWRSTKTGGFHCHRNGGTMTVKKARTGMWYLVVNQSMVQGQWFRTAEEAKWQGDQL
jgi:hypothetical protein